MSVWGDANGSEDIGQHIESNQCTTTAEPLTTGTCNSQQGGVTVNPGCVEYQGCMARTVFCNHDDPHYSSTNHGWPCFANGQIFEFFESLP